jgi:hypothetical protein
MVANRRGPHARIDADEEDLNRPADAIFERR